MTFVQAGYGGYRTYQSGGRGGRRNGGNRPDISNSKQSFKAPTEGLENIVFDTANPYRIAVDFSGSVKALENYVGINFRKVSNVALWAL